ncbi:DDE-type integrase/transposase/recombinase, partial [Noviherbaspirillum pedocola]|uniref:DDE-type integrase/transposase/recombinase n=1 Tax=Noviherbaspirillum pedocola TaxID=2801341 RepID=UPI00227989C2
MANCSRIAGHPPEPGVLRFHVPSRRDYRVLTGDRMTRHLVMQALFRAVSLRRPAPGLIQHTDRGSQYCSHEYRALVAQFGMRASMSRRGNCYDNAPIESFWGTL